MNNHPIAIFYYSITHLNDPAGRSNYPVDILKSMHYSAAHNPPIAMSAEPKLMAPLSPSINL